MSNRKQETTENQIINLLEQQIELMTIIMDRRQLPDHSSVCKDDEINYRKVLDEIRNRDKK